MKRAILSFAILFNPLSLLSEESHSTSQVSLEKIGTNFGELVEAYESGRLAYPSIIFDYLHPYVDKEASVLDIGCGSGKSTRPLFERFKDVHGIDLDTKMLEFAKKNSPEHAQQFQQGSVYQLPYEQETFNLVTMASSFHWFCNERAVKEIARVLKKGGYIYLIRAGSAPFQKEKEAIISSFTGLSSAELGPHRKGYAPQILLTENGFTIIEEKELNYDLVYTVEEGLQNYQSHSDWHFVKEAHKEKETLAELRKLLESKTNEEGLILVEGKAKVLLAQKTS